jgi:hypothetical protein
VFKLGFVEGLFHCAHHKDIKNTLVYIDLEHEIFQNIDEYQFTTKVAYIPDEACKLREVGFEKFDEFDGAHLYCKRKSKKARGCVPINILGYVV